MATTWRQKERQRTRERSGRYTEMNRCEACGRPAGDYVSDSEICNSTGVGLVLCSRKSCPYPWDQPATERIDWLYDRKNPPEQDGPGFNWSYR